jgi:peptidoglycan hydrolase CwlO-like protein
LGIFVAVVVAILGLIFKCSDDNIMERVEDNKSEIRENKRILDENRERIIKLEEKNKGQAEEVNVKPTPKK